MITGAVATGRRVESALSLSPAVRRDLYEQMVLTRVFETEAERQYKAARIGGYCHLSSGQEATMSGVVHALRDDDLLVTGYRCHRFALARGVSPQSVMAELFGRSDGCAHGRGGSMHLLDVSRGFYGGWGIVAGQLPVATGLALALVRQRRPHAVPRRGSGAGHSTEVVDLRSLRPLDVETVATSVAKTNHVVCVEEGWPSYGVTAELAARIQKACFDDLDAPVERVGMAEVPLPYAKNLELAAIPSEERLIAATLATLGGSTTAVATPASPA